MGKLYWEMMADEIAAAGWTYGIAEHEVAFIGRVCVVDAHRGDGHRYIAMADEMLAAFLQLRRMLREAEDRK